MFESLTRYLPELANKEFGVWIDGDEGDGTLERPLQVPHVNYSSSIDNFTHDVYSFVDNHEEMGLDNYQGILKENRVKWDADSITSMPIEKLDAQCVIAIILSAVRAERFCVGALLGFFENGSMERCLLRLKELDTKEKGGLCSTNIK